MYFDTFFQVKKVEPLLELTDFLFEVPEDIDAKVLSFNFLQGFSVNETNI